MTITNKNRLIAKTALQNFRGNPVVAKYWDDNNTSNIDILETLNRPYEGITSYSTIGLSDIPIGYSVDEKSRNSRCWCYKFEYFPNILSTCAFNIMNSKLSIFNGSIFNDVVNMYYPNSEM